MSNGPSNPTGTRLASLDAFRGLVMLALLTGGGKLKAPVPHWDWLLTQFDHVEWEGCVFWDLIQPAFMFIVGVAMPFSYAARESRGQTPTQQFRHVLVRVAKLLVLGWMLDNFGSSSLQLGFIRVLQQIAFGYFFSFFLLNQRPSTQGLVAAMLLVGYAVFWMWNPWNGPGGPWANDGENVGRVFDRWMLGRNYSGGYVGMNAIPATANMIFGVMCGSLLLHRKQPTFVVSVLIFSGIAAILLGFFLSPIVPIIKRIWTPSFAIFSTGWTVLLLGLFYGLIDVLDRKAWAYPLLVVGANSAAAYVMANAFVGWFRSLSHAWIVWLQAPMGEFAVHVLQRLLFVVAAWLVLWWMNRRKIFISL